ncbi:MAG: Na(+)-translocating NADH-quinone reductase subunit A [Calditrichaeota bacterium]|nr:Na(+)-translocating NADH-quinone reductase subunit A [Calditrichota bacterium]
MGTIHIKKGLNLPIAGEPVQQVDQGQSVNRVALLGDDYVGMKPTMMVQIGDQVKLGQLLFTDKKMPGVKFTSPGSGKVVEINRGAKRKFLSIVIELEGNDEITFDSYSEDQLNDLDRNSIKKELIESGMWPLLRARPFSKVAEPEGVPHSIFVTAMDTNPLAPSVEKILEGNENYFKNGLNVISKLTDGTVFLCKAAGTNIPTFDLNSLSVNEFSGPHPAGLVGTHIHFLDPVGRSKTVWTIGAQDVVTIGILFTAGKINVDRIVSLAGPAVKNPRLVKTRIGASLDDLTAGELKDGDNRVVSGSVLSGFKAAGETAFLGRYHQQVSVLPEGRKREFLGWLDPGVNLYSVKKVLLSSTSPHKKFNFNTALYGGKRAIVPVGSYEKVMPLDILPTFLLRALAVDDVEEAEKLGCLELDEEDLALCTYVCPSKIDHGAELRRNLTIIEKEG